MHAIEGTMGARQKAGCRAFSALVLCQDLASFVTQVEEHMQHNKLGAPRKGCKDERGCQKHICP
jgi:hypothetical protein